MALKLCSSKTERSIDQSQVKVERGLRVYFRARELCKKLTKPGFAQCARSPKTLSDPIEVANIKPLKPSGAEENDAATNCRIAKLSLAVALKCDTCANRERLTSEKTFRSNHQGGATSPPEKCSRMNMFEDVRCHPHIT